LNPERTTL